MSSVLENSSSWQQSVTEVSAPPTVSRRLTAADSPNPNTRYLNANPAAPVMADVGVPFPAAMNNPMRAAANSLIEEQHTELVIIEGDGGAVTPHTHINTTALSAGHRNAVEAPTAEPAPLAGEQARGHERHLSATPADGVELAALEHVQRTHEQQNVAVPIPGAAPQPGVAADNNHATLDATKASTIEEASMRLIVSMSEEQLALLNTTYQLWEADRLAEQTRLRQPQAEAVFEHGGAEMEDTATLAHCADDDAGFHGPPPSAAQTQRIVVCVPLPVAQLPETAPGVVTQPSHRFNPNRHQPRSPQPTRDSRPISGGTNTAPPYRQNRHASGPNGPVSSNRRSNPPAQRLPHRPQRNQPERPARPRGNNNNAGGDGGGEEHHICAVHGKIRSVRNLLWEWCAPVSRYDWICKPTARCREQMGLPAPVVRAQLGMTRRLINRPVITVADREQLMFHQRRFEEAFRNAVDTRPDGEGIIFSGRGEPRAPPPAIDVDRPMTPPAANTQGPVAPVVWTAEDQLLAHRMYTPVVVQHLVATQQAQAANGHIVLFGPFPYPPPVAPMESAIHRAPLNYNPVENPDPTVDTPATTPAPQLQHPHSGYPEMQQLDNTQLRPPPYPNPRHPRGPQQPRGNQNNFRRHG